MQLLPSCFSASVKATNMPSYYYEEGTSTEVRWMMLVVYFNEDGHYEGYM